MSESKHMGCVTDFEFTKAVMEMYPNRKFNHTDQYRRRELIHKKRDIPELAQAMQKRENRRCYEVPLADTVLDSLRWNFLRWRHRFEHEYRITILTKEEQAKAIRIFDENKKSTSKTI